MNVIFVEIEVRIYIGTTYIYFRMCLLILGRAVVSSGE